MMSIPKLNITNVKVYPTYRDSGLLASCHLVINDTLSIRSIKLMKGSLGLYLKYPSRLSPFGRAYEMVAPHQRLQRLQIRRAIIRAYKKALQNSAPPQEMQLSLFPSAA